MSMLTSEDEHPGVRDRGPSEGGRTMRRARDDLHDALLPLGIREFVALRERALGGARS